MVTSGDKRGTDMRMTWLGYIFPDDLGIQANRESFKNKLDCSFARPSTFIPLDRSVLT